MMVCIRVIILIISTLVDDGDMVHWMQYVILLSENMKFSFLLLIWRPWLKVTFYMTEPLVLAISEVSMGSRFMCLWMLRFRAIEVGES